MGPLNQASTDNFIQKDYAMNRNLRKKNKAQKKSNMKNFNVISGGKNPIFKASISLRRPGLSFFENSQNFS